MAKKEVKDIVLLVDFPQGSLSRVITAIKKRYKRKYKTLLLYPQKVVGRENPKVMKEIDYAVPCNYDSDKDMVSALAPYKDRIVAVHWRLETQSENFKKLIPNIPYLRTSSTESIDWSVDKAKMRRRFSIHDKKITPKFKIAKDSTKETIKAIEKKVGFPLVIKPANLTASMLVNVVFHKEELEKELKKVFRRVRSAYKSAGRKVDPVVLVEQFVEGDLYSIDGYVNSRGKIYFCPMVEVKTGKQIGFDDFFGYQQITPTKLGKQSISNAEVVAGKGVRALGLRSTIFHAELLKHDDKWFVVEIAPRTGGFRQELYELSYGINHFANAVDIATPKIPKIVKTVKKHSAALKIFAKQEGIIKNIVGVKKAKELKSINQFKVNKKVGDKVRFAKNGGKSVINVIMANKDRSKLLADIRRLEQLIKIEVKKK